MRRQYLIEGAVQGVGFRYFTWRKARQLGVRGWVRNLRDGRVEVLAEGDPPRLGQLETELRRGPDAASVTSLRQAENSSQEELPDTFEIR